MSRLLWAPSQRRINDSNMYRFMQHINQRHGTNFDTYHALYQWSIDNLEDFWAAMWDFAGIKASKSYDEIIDDPGKMPGTRWFRGSRLNFAENLLRYRDDETAIIFKGEDVVRRTLSYAELYESVRQVATALRKSGVVAGDRVVGFMPNMPETIIAMLAATSLGAVWSSCSPDFGIKGVLDRFGQTAPKVLFCADGYFFKGKAIDSLERIRGIAAQIPSFEKIVVVPYISTTPDITDLQGGIPYHDFRAGNDEEIAFVQLPFDHPLYVMYSSGTTGLPKCMVQSAGGVLINQLKELILHTDLKREDTIFYFTTCGWMMWNWLTASLGVGATLVLFDGNPFHPGPEALWRMAEDEKISIFGTSAGYIAALKQAGVKPGRQFDLSSLKAVALHRLAALRRRLPLHLRRNQGRSAAGIHLGWVRPQRLLCPGQSHGDRCTTGELQCRGLGMAVYAYDEHRKAGGGPAGGTGVHSPVSFHAHLFLGG